MSLIKKPKKIYWWFALPILLFIIVVLVFRFFSFDDTIKNKEQYIKVVGPKLAVVIADPSYQNINKTKDFLFNIKSQDRSIGDYHLPLYMSFVLWTKYLESNDSAQISKAIGILEELKVILPEFSESFTQIISLMKVHVQS